MPPKKNAAGRSKDTIHFVNARPSSESEKLDIKRMVRAHVGKWISTQTTRNQLGIEVAGVGPAGPVSAVLDHSHPHPPPLVTVKSETAEHTLAFKVEPDDAYLPSIPASASASTLSPDSSVSGSSRDSPVSSISSSSHNSHVSITSTPRSRELVVATIPARTFVQTVPDICYRCEQEACRCDSPSSDSADSGEYIEAIGAGSLDPFRVYAGQFEPELVRTSEEYCLSCLWPGLTPGPSGTNMQSWFPMSLSDPTLFTAFLFGSLSHMRIQALNGWIPRHMFASKQQRMLEIVEDRTIQLVSREIENPTRAICDSIIFSVVCMAHSQKDERLTEVQSIPFTSPMQRLQWLDVYGSLPPNLVHVGGLVQMVKLRGGIDKIKLPGLASIISFSDLVASATFLSRPIFPFVPLEERRRDFTMQDYLGYTTASVNQYHAYFQPLGLPRILTELICAMNTYTALVDRCISGQTSYEPSLLADQRNIIHYTLLCLPASVPEQANANTHNQNNTFYTPHESVYEPFRLATLIYSVGVILPIPAQSTPLQKLAAYLQQTLALSTTHHPHLWNNPQSQVILLWILSLGAIAATNTPCRNWFVESLARIVEHNRIVGFEALKGYLGVVAWYGVACDTPCIRLWGDVEGVLGRVNGKGKGREGDRRSGFYG